MRYLLASLMLILFSCENQPTETKIDQYHHYPFSVYGKSLIYSYGVYFPNSNARVNLSLLDNSDKHTFTDGDGFYSFSFPANSNAEVNFVELEGSPENSTTILRVVDVNGELFSDREINFLSLTTNSLNLRCNIEEVIEGEPFTLQWDDVSPFGYNLENHLGLSHNLATDSRGISGTSITIIAPAIPDDATGQFHCEYILYAVKNANGDYFKWDTITININPS